ncbi:alcohol dehydrogenase family protein [Marinobacterium rhizophilum]|uniref:Alcohol dehydrogenase family protein n=1 Tax=Marinobacterium rhizophilum TaxID=420402 RepID=A0ABY5HMQ6_9GAMM|nr:alcohol dehydrogenase family protein [Marinobacterium rhizophilum]UTW13087.1 alcohol dehydrogenase family protein [Marinobacterium rhizophilum]
MNDTPVPKFMTGVQLTGHGGLDKLQYRQDLAVPQPGAGEVLIRVGAAGINNTDINTRIGWYSKGVSGATDQGAAQGFDTVRDDDGGWAGVPLEFPRIQGADCCGEIVAVGSQVDAARVGQRVLVRTMQSAPDTQEDYQCVTYGSEFDGGFAQYAIARSSEAFAVNSDLGDIELASFPCAYSTAEGMLERAQLQAGERVLITGASGGVGSAAVQLARRRGAYVIAVCGAQKRDDVLALGADEVIARGDNLVTALGADSVDVVVDLVAGPQWPQLCDVLRRGGRYAVSGAIAGPLVELDVRTLYLKDLTFLGCTWQPKKVFENLIGYIERGEIRPLVAKSYPLEQIVAAQEAFMAKTFTGKLVLVPPAVD